MPNMLHISFVDIEGVGYSGDLKLVGDNRLELIDICSVTLPLKAADKAQEEISQMRDENESLRALVSAQQKNISALNAELEAARAAATAQAAVAAQTAAAIQAAAAAQTVAE